MTDIGRPPVIDEAVLHKLEEVFALGGTDKEACLYAGIAPATLYNYQKLNPDFIERKEALKETPVLKARRTVVKSLEEDVNSAWRLLERKDKELNPRQNIDLTSKDEKIDFKQVKSMTPEEIDEYIQQKLSGGSKEPA